MDNDNEWKHWQYGDGNGPAPCEDPDPEDLDRNAPWYKGARHGLAEDDDRDPDGEWGACANCDTPLTFQQAQRGSPYCSEKCRQTAKVVRYGRATMRDGRYDHDPLIARAITVRIAFVLTGGYPAKARRLTLAQRNFIFERDGWRCQICGAAANEIHHLHGSSSDPENLQAVCGLCNMGEVEAKLGPATPAEAREIETTGEVEANLGPATPTEAREIETIWARIRAQEPSRPCDDEKTWNEAQKVVSAELRRRARPARSDRDPIRRHEHSHTRQLAGEDHQRSRFSVSAQQEELLQEWMGLQDVATAAYNRLKQIESEEGGRSREAGVSSMRIEATRAYLAATNQATDAFRRYLALESAKGA